MILKSMGAATDHRTNRLGLALLGFLVLQTCLAAEGGSMEWHSGFSGPGFLHSVRALTVYQGDLIAGGAFDSAGESVRNGIARWNGDAWVTLGNASVMDAEVEIYALAEYDGELIAGGLFSEIGGVAANNIARWDGEHWAALANIGANGVDGRVSALEVFNGELIVGGRFEEAGGVTVNHVARWDGHEWRPLGQAPDVGVEYSGQASQIGVHALGRFAGELIVGGRFDLAGGVEVQNIARWNGTSWASFNAPEEQDISGTVYALSEFDGELVAGGSFFNAGGGEVRNIARWDGNDWLTLAGPFGPGMDNGLIPSATVYALAVAEGRLIAGGWFNRAGGQNASHVASWDGEAWSAIEGSNGESTAGSVLTLASFEGNLIAGGEFLRVGEIRVNSIARWDGSEWHALGAAAGFGDQVTSLVRFNDMLVAGGWFEWAGANSIYHIAQWDGNEWQPLAGSVGAGLSGGLGRVGDILEFQNELIVGGNFVYAGGRTANNIARWNGEDWLQIQSGAYTGLGGEFGSVRALTVFNGELIVAGGFGDAGDKVVNGIARWDGSEWQPLEGTAGIGVEPPSINAVAVFNGFLYVGGPFIQAGGRTFRNIARWDGNDWHPVWGQHATNSLGTVHSLAVYCDQLYAGFEKDTVGNETYNRIASWDGKLWYPLHGPLGAGLSGNTSAMTVFDGALIVGGRFDTAGGIAVNNVARWNGRKWSALEGPFSTGANGRVAALATFDSDLLVGGEFTIAGGVPSWRIARYASVSDPTQVHSDRFEAPFHDCR